MTKAVLVALLAVLISGCASTSPLSSNVLDKDAKPSNAMRVVYLPDMFLGNQKIKVRIFLSEVHYYQLGALLRRRVPVVFALNGISTDVGKGSGARGAVAPGATMRDGRSRRVLVLHIVGGTVISKDNVVDAGHLNLKAELFETPPMAGRPIWTGLFDNAMNVDGIEQTKFDQKYVDQMLGKILAQLAKDKMITLAHAKVQLPAVSGAKGK